MSRRPLAIFAALWAIGELFHQASNTKFGLTTGETAITMLAVWLLLKPSSLWRFLIFVAVQVLVVGDQLPFVPNHFLLVGLVDATTLSAAAILWIERRRLSSEELYVAMGPPIRAIVVIVYSWAAIHKFNSAYFDPATSCGVMLSQYLATDLGAGALSPALQTLAIYVSLGIEVAIPAALFFRKTRTLGVLLGLVFHFVLGLVTYDRYYNFSSLILALYLLFTPSDLPQRVEDLLTRMRLWQGVRSDALGRWFAAGAFAAAIAVTIANPRLFDRQEWHVAVAFVARTIWIVYGGAILLVFVAALRRPSLSVPAAPGPLRWGWVLALFPAVAALNGFMPYVGLKTEISFAMFSNLRTEERNTNHWFLPVRWRAADYQEDLVQVISSSETNSERIPLAGDGYAMTFFELWREASRNPNLAVTYIRDGQTYAVARAGDDPMLSRPFPWALGKLLRFRPVEVTGPVRCKH